jgi:hypothetical protein
VTCIKKWGENVIFGCFWALWKVQNEAIPTVPPGGQTQEWKALKLSVKAANVPQWPQSSQENIWLLGDAMGDGAEKQAMKCEMCTESDKEGSGLERQSQ